MEMRVESSRLFKRDKAGDFHRDVKQVRPVKCFLMTRASVSEAQSQSVCFISACSVSSPLEASFPQQWHDDCYPQVSPDDLFPHYGVWASSASCLFHEYPLSLMTPSSESHPVMKSLTAFIITVWQKPRLDDDVSNLLKLYHQVLPTTFFLQKFATPLWCPQGPNWADGRLILCLCFLKFLFSSMSSCNIAFKLPLWCYVETENIIVCMSMCNDSFGPFTFTLSRSQKSQRNIWDVWFQVIKEQLYECILPVKRKFTFFFVFSLLKKSLGIVYQDICVKGAYVSCDAS